MPAPLNPEKREQIEAAIRAGGKRNEIARDLGVAGSTVGKIAKELETKGDIDGPAFDRAQTKEARAALDVDQGVARAEFAKVLTEDWWALRTRMWEDQVDYLGSMDGPVRIVRPTNAREFKDFATAIGILVDKVDKLTREDSEGLAAVDAWLKSITGIG